MDSKLLRTMAMALIICVTGIGACGDNGGDDDPDGPMGSFSVQLSGDVSEELSSGREGGASFHLNAPEGYCFMQLSDLREEGMFSIGLYFKGQSCPGVGSYEVAQDQGSAVAGQVWGMVTDGTRAMPVLYRTHSGTVEITSREDSWLIGNLNIDFVGLADANLSFSAEGEFEAWPEIIQVN